ncbi:MAG: cysteine desulfurase [Acidimicrobiia bacterium]|nr:cysteine desulfurase [Acidimicrobiia bacterium]
MLYLDHAATTPMRPQVWEAMEPYVSDRFGNSSGSHEVSRRAKNALESARERASELLGCRPQEIVFTGGGTESDNLAVKGAALAGGGRGGVVVGATEHEAVLEAAEFLGRLGCSVTIADVDPYGLVDPEQVANLVDDGTAVVSVMAVNNETGTVQDVAAVVEAVRRINPATAVHTDAIQAFVSHPIDVEELGVDLLSLTGHKFGGPKGVGLLYVRDGRQLEPVLHGGGQELGRRSGTHDVMGVVGLVEAMELGDKDRERLVADVTVERRAFEEAVASVASRTIPEEHASAQHSHIGVHGIRNETLLVRLDRRGLAVSAASACQSGANTVSHVLTAMGMSADVARECLRVSFGWSTRPGDGQRAGQILLEAVDGMR